MEHFSEKRYPLNPTDYKLYEEVGDGVSATVYRALCIPLNEVVAIKVLDLEKCNNDLDGIRREVQTMTLTNHPNLLRALCSFTADHSLWVVMPFMAGGSCLHIMKSAHPDGFEEPVIATLLREVLKALVYLHGHGHIHRDVKAGNILVDVNGAVKLADFGVSACMFDTGDRQRSRNTFVGTPCWMAPEVMQQLHGYDFKADIWSFGITALELAHGHAPFSKYPPMKVLLMTLQNAPPGLDYERDKRFSKSFKAMVATCLVKDPKKRPNSEKLLKHPFFKQARSNEYLARNILDGLSPLGDRFRTVKAKEADFLLNNKAMHGNEVHLSQQEYIRGISGWNFNLEDLKTQASLIQSADGTVHLESNHKPMDARDEDNFAEEILSHDRVNHANAPVKSADGPHHPPNFERLLASSFPDRPLQALKGCFDVCDDENSASSPNWKDEVQSSSEPVHPLQQSLHGENLEYVKSSDENTERRFSVSKSFHVPEHPKFLSGSLLPEHVLSPSRSIGDAKRGDLRHKFQSERNYSAPLLYRQMKDAQTGTSATTFEETSEGRIVQSKGRFKVTSADACSKGIPSTNYSANPVSGALTNPTVFAASLLPSFQYVLQQNAMQREQLIKLIKYLEQISGQQSEPADVGSGDLSQISPASSRERELQAYLVHLQQSVGKLVEEVQKLNIQNAQLEQQVNSFFGKNKEETIQKEKETQR